MSKARLVAQLLVKRFMVEGCMVVSPQRLGSPEEGIQLASARDKRALWEETAPFTRLAVQAVGVEEGKENPGVVVYASKGAARLFKSMPKEMDGVPISYYKIGPVSVQPEQVNKVEGEPNFYQRDGRVACGSSCATATGDAGTLGALVARKDDASIYVLSNNHVLAGCNHIAPGMPIISPAPNDSRPDHFLPTSIARLTETIPIRAGDYRLVKPCEEDVAIGRVVNDTLVSSWQGDSTDGYDTPSKIGELWTTRKVKKFGRTTGLTHGTIHSQIREPIPIFFQNRDFKGVVWFVNAWYVLGSDLPFALPGDSGSLVVSDDGEEEALGVLFSSNSTGAIGAMLSIEHLAEKLKVSLISGHGT